MLSSKVGQRTHYDPAGRVLQQTIQRSSSPAPLVERRYRYDAAGQLSRIEDSRKGGIDYRYDPVGRLIEAISRVAKERFAFDPASNIVDPVRSSDTPASRPRPVRPESTLPAEAGPVVGIETPEWKSSDRYVPQDDPLQKVPQRRADAKLFYYHCDQIGTPQLLTDDDGDVVWEASYKAWGEAREVIARASKAAGIVARNSLRFQGQQEDEETGLHYNRYRYYDPTSGRFTSADPIRLAGGSNVYQYALNLVSWIDPFGFSSTTDGTGNQVPVNEYGISIATSFNPRKILRHHTRETRHVVPMQGRRRRFRAFHVSFVESLRRR
ncbi:Protein RhsD [Burkholderia multivorans]|nr:Protein RhsD [Burkholderia multivorans]MDR9269769.1 Protein RhsD [Burkholderia multivorans]MDR9286422.1 Protein RhsD [Burkholderia multivorans]MDR9292555.1 Protein RhsD [Burkholderia multivorans]MDR9315574.1 Protein RhsD [Burkholderia multivorans]